MLVESQFQLGREGQLFVTDEEIFSLLSNVYVKGGFTDQNVALNVFDPQKVRHRGDLIIAREKRNDELAGMVVLVSPDSPACKFAENSECEMHLLGVADDYRGHGLGKLLVEAVIDAARTREFVKMLLWTQPPMKTAQKLYKNFGFRRVAERDFEHAERNFIFFEKSL